MIRNSNSNSDSRTAILSLLSSRGFTLAAKKKTSMRELMHIFTGQNWLKHSLSKRDPNTAPDCKHCMEQPETAEHFIGRCPFYAHLRLQIFGTPETNLADIVKQHKTSKITEFINRSSRLAYDYYPEEYLT